MYIGIGTIVVIVIIVLIVLLLRRGLILVRPGPGRRGPAARATAGGRYGAAASR